MADPLSITLAVVSLATSLKDIIELAQTLNDSFKKPGRNMQRAESLAAETLAIVQELKKFYDAHTEVLDSAPDMQDAVLRLLREMETVHEKCIPILQVHTAPDGKIHTWIKRKVGPWWKRNSVEESIRNLRDGANKCRSDFMMYTLIRIEATTSQVQVAIAHTQATAVRIEATSIEIRGAVMHAGFAGPRLQPSTAQVSDDNVLAFLGSTPVILSQLPPHVKLAEHLVYKEYITLQVGKIDILFKAFSSARSYPVEEPDTVHLRQFETVIYLKPVTKEEVEDMQSHIFALIVKIQDSIQGRHNNGLSVQRGASAMSELSGWLDVFDMDQESLTIAQFAVDIYRTLTKTNEDVYGTHLAHALYLLSYRLVDTGDLVQAYKAITEAVTLGRRLVAANPTFEYQIGLAYLVRYSAFVAHLNGDLENAIQDAEEAVHIHERLVGHSTSVLQMELNIINKMSGPTDMMLDRPRIYGYAQAMAELHYSLSSTSRKNESVGAGIEALELYSALEQRHNYPHFSLHIADLCYSLASDDIRDVISIDQALSYALKAVSQYEKVLQHTGNVPRNLPFSLARQAKILSDLDRIEEAYVVCQKLQQMVHKHIENHQLRAESLLQLTKNLYRSRRYVEATLVGEQLLATYRSSLLGWDLCGAYDYTSCAFGHEGNTFKAVQIAESAVSYWRMLAFHNSENIKFLATSLHYLADQLRSAAEHGRAFSAGHEAMALYNGLIKKNSFLVENYTKTLQLNMDIARQAKMEPMSVERGQEVIRYSRALIKQYPEHQMFHIRCIFDHTHLLEDSDQLAEGSAVIEEALTWFDTHPAKEEGLAGLHTTILIGLGRLLRDQGHLDKALSAHDKVIKIGQPFAKSHYVASNLLWAKTETLMILYIMGQVPLALDRIEDCLTFAAKHDLKDLEYAFYLTNSSLVSRFSGDVDNALSNIRKSIDILEDEGRTPHSWILSDLLADAGEEEEALIAAHKAIQGCERLQKPSSTIHKEYYAQAQYSLSLRLFAANNLDQAREQLLDVRLFYQQHSQTRNLWFIKLAITLWALGNLECASGRHEEGVAARSELDDLRKRLRLIFPSLDDLVEVGLKRERIFASWKNLLKKINLMCAHQDEEDILESAVISQYANLGIPSDEPIGLAD